MKVSILKTIACISLLFSAVNLTAQCGTPINTFPYIENFETSAAWTTGGPTNSRGNVINDWAWGTPAKATINRAGSGQKCWITGGLSGTTYASGERSYIQSPCFDFTSLVHPYVTFLIFWESEWEYDGAVFQYSTNSGTTWTNLGGYNDPVDCLDSNWFNYNSVDGLGSQSLGGTTYPALASPNDGWCGNIQSHSGSGCQLGHGSGTWVLARKCMASLTGVPSVIFRFAFGAGTTCNTFDGIAIDSISIGEAPPNTANFSYTCVNTNTLSFTGITTMCPTSFTWNFDDPASGGSNTATSLTPDHTFSAPGSYNVSFTASGGCNADSTIVQTIYVVDGTALPINISCPGRNDGMAYVNAHGATGYTYDWSTSPAQHTDTASGLSTGIYDVTITSGGACAATAQVTISQQPALVHTVVSDSASCGGSNGVLTVHETGGSPAYTYTWSMTGTDSSASDLAPGVYSITIVDSRGCRDSLSAPVGNTGNLQATASVLHETSCAGTGDGSAALVLAGATGWVHYHWSNGATTDTAANLAAGPYTVTVSDSSGCSAVKSVNITQPQPLLHAEDSTAATCGNSNGIIAIHESGGTGTYTYTWSPSGSGDSSASLSPGVYHITITDQNGCRDSLTTTVTAMAFTPVVIDSADISCYGRQDGMVAAAGGGTAPVQYLWSNQATTDSIINLAPGIYSVTATDASHCTSSANASVSQPDSLSVSAVLLPDTCGAGAGSILVDVHGGTAPYHYAWSPSGDNAGQITALTAGTYSLTISDARACSLPDSYTIGDTCIFDSLVFPTAFTPNGDGLNDTFGPVYAGSVTDYQLHIYDRWGELVYESTDPLSGWDGRYKGTQQSGGSYTYYATFTGHKRKAMQGTLMLLR